MGDDRMVSIGRVLMNNGAEIERLRRWQTEAITVINEWHAVFNLLFTKGPGGPFAADLGLSKSAIAAREIIRLRSENSELRTQIDELSARERYVDDLGVDWCVLHNGVRNEDSDRCDAFDWSDEDDMIDENGEYLPCDLRPLVYREVVRG